MRLIIVSNRLPITVKAEDGKNGSATWKLAPSSGGLITSIESYLQKQEVKNFLWFGWPGAEVDKKQENIVREKLLKEKNAIPVFLDKNTREDFYEGFCNKVIWPLFHYFTEKVIYDQNFWETYKAVNQKFCDSILRNTKEDDFIWIHDYQLMLLPDMIRKARPQAKIGFFLHIPFPSSDIFNFLPKEWRISLLYGLLGADVIGFHTQDYTQNFLRCLLRFLGYVHSMGEVVLEDRLVLIRTMPLGIDFEKFYGGAVSKLALAEKKELSKSLKARKVILSLDRLDYTKGILHRLYGYKQFLEDNPKWHKKVLMVLVIIPSRTNVESYGHLKQQIEELIARINGQFGSIDWTPILYQYNSLNPAQLSAYYSIADIALITPLRDGMNLIAKEYVASKNQEPGVLILSEMAGAARELTDALIINPNSEHEIAMAIENALTMPKDIQKKKIASMQETLKRANVYQWINNFIDYIEEAKQEQDKLKAKVLNSNKRITLKNQIQKARKRIFFLDYDGTLINYKKHPDMGKPTPALMQTIKKLSQNKDNEVVIISGRTRKDLDNWFKDLPVHLVAEHGLLLKKKWSGWKVENFATDWKKEALRILRFYVEQVKGSFIEEKEYSLAWHYRVADPILAEVKSKELLDDLIQLIANKNLQIIHGAKVIEIKPLQANKGTAVKEFLFRRHFDLILAAGDDITDEDMFRALNETTGQSQLNIFPFMQNTFGIPDLISNVTNVLLPDANIIPTKNQDIWTIKVGSSKTQAKYFMHSPEDMVELLKEIASESKSINRKIFPALPR